MISGYVRAAVHLICLKYILFLSLLSRLECAHQIQKISSIAQHPDSRRIDSVCSSKWTPFYYPYWSSIFIRSNLFQHFGAAVISRLRKKLLETKILNDDHSGRSMRLVGKQYCRHRQAFWHPEQVSGEHRQHHCHYVSPHNHWCRPSVSKIPHVPGSPILTLNAISSENVETRSCKSRH